MPNTASLELGHAFANRVHDAAQVRARDQREVVLHAVLVGAGRHEEVGGLGRRRLQLHPNLACRGRRVLQFVDGAGSTEFIDRECRQSRTSWFRVGSLYVQPH
jgi:hypothetical protein